MVKEKALVGLFLIFRRRGGGSDVVRQRGKGPAVPRIRQRTDGQKKRFYFLSEKRLTPAPQGFNLLWGSRAASSLPLPKR